MNNTIENNSECKSIVYDYMEYCIRLGNLYSLTTKLRLFKMLIITKLEKYVLELWVVKWMLFSKVWKAEAKVRKIYPFSKLPKVQRPYQKYKDRVDCRPKKRELREAIVDHYDMNRYWVVILYANQFCVFVWSKLTNQSIKP